MSLSQPHHLCGHSRHVLFICKGNICRSPAAEVVLRDLAGISIETRSRGTHPWHRGKGAHPAMIRATASRGFDLTQHIAQEVTEPDLVWADDILVMDQTCLDLLRHRFSEDLVAKARLYLETGEDVPDPYNHPDDLHEATLRLIEQAAHAYLRALDSAKIGQDGAFPAPG